MTFNKKKKNFIQFFKCKLNNQIKKLQKPFLKNKKTYRQNMMKIKNNLTIN